MRFPGTRSVRAGARLDREEVEDALLGRVEIVLNVLRALVQEEVRDHAGDGDAETERRVVHGFGDAVREHLLALRGRELLVRDGAERVNQTDDGSEQTDERRDVRERPERSDALLDRGLQLA